MECPICEGEGGWTEVIDYWIGGPYYECSVCDGDGYISIWAWLSFKFWTNVPIRFLEWYADWRWPIDENEVSLTFKGEENEEHN